MIINIVFLWIILIFIGLVITAHVIYTSRLRNDIIHRISLQGKILEQSISDIRYELIKPTLIANANKPKEVDNCSTVSTHGCRIKRQYKAQYEQPLYNSEKMSRE